MKTKTMVKKNITLSNAAPTTLERAPIPGFKNTAPKISIPKHSVLIHPKSYNKQPQGYEMGKITNDLKRLYSEYIPVTKILDYFGKGHNIILSDTQIDENNSFKFISSSVFAIDVDDVEKMTDPSNVIFEFKDMAAGIFFTFSHGKKGKGNRYRLFFQLDQVITDESKMRAIIGLISDDLKDKGLPVDEQAQNPLQVVRGGIKSILIDANNKLNTNHLLERVKRKNQKRQKELYTEFEKELRPVPFKELKEMAETIGHIPTGVGQGELWKRLVVGIKHYANTEFITQDEGFELFDIISGGEQSSRAWDTLRASGQATIRSLIYEARQRGYKGRFTYYTNEETIESFERKIIRVKKHIPTDVAKDILVSEQKILVDSPTGSGKTTAFLNAFKDLANETAHFYIFAMPTIALTLQNAHKHKVKAIKGQTKNLFKSIYRSIKNGDRVFISTYDMIPALIDFISSIERHMTFTLVVDEFHKFVTDYDTNYRYEAINNLYKISKQAKTLIGLSGTIDDIYKDEFDKIIRIDNGLPTSPCQEFAVYTYEKRKNALSELAQLIEKWTEQRKLLIYIQSKKKIEQLKRVLQRKKIRVRTISANSKRNKTYKQLIEQETIDDNVQVILTTSVIADGVSIQNGVDWEVIAVCNEFSNLFNYSSIKQISNRLRNNYRRFSIYMQEPRNQSTDPFYIESAYKWRKNIAENIVNEINEHPYFDMQLFRRSVIEKRYGIYKGFEGLEVDSLYLRHAVSKEQERYYTSFRLSFIKAVQNALHTELSGVLNISEEIKNNRLDLSLQNQIIADLEEISKKSDEEKEQNIKNTFTSKIYKAFKENNETITNQFKQMVIPRHYACLSRLSSIADYETCKKIVSCIKRDSDTHSFYNDITNIVDVMYFQSIKRPNKTKNIINKLLKLNEFISNKQYNKEIDRIAKETRVTAKDVKLVEKMMMFESERQGKDRTRVKRITGTLSLKHISNKHNVNIRKVGEVIKSYAATQTKTTQTIVRNILNDIFKEEQQKLT